MYKVPQKKARLRDDTPVKLTKDDKEYLEWVQNQSYTCFVCGCQNGIEWHHVKRDSTDKKNHKRLIPLCGAEHHRLGDLSPHGNPKKWRDTYTMDEQNDFADHIYKQYVLSLWASND